MFYLTKIENGRMNVPEPEFYNVGTTAISAGEAVALSSGVLVKSNTAPTHIAAVDANGTAKHVPVYRIEKNQVYSVPCASTPSAFVVGAKLAINSDCLQAGAASDTGILTIVDTLGAKAVGDEILVRF